MLKPPTVHPYVCLDKDKNLFEIAGKSKPSNVFEFYDPILNWLDRYMESPNPKTLAFHTAGIP